MKRIDATNPATEPRPLTPTMLAVIEGGAGGQPSPDQSQGQTEQQGPGLDEKWSGPTAQVYTAWQKTFGGPHPNSIRKPTLLERLQGPPQPQSTGDGTQQQ
jgi:hypothetical protein